MGKTIDAVIYISPLAIFVADSNSFKTMQSSLITVHSIVVKLFGGFYNKPSDARTGFSSKIICSSI